MSDGSVDSDWSSRGSSPESPLPPKEPLMVVSSPAEEPLGVRLHSAPQQPKPKGAPLPSIGASPGVSLPRPGPSLPAVEPAGAAKLPPLPREKSVRFSSGPAVGRPPSVQAPPSYDDSEKGALPGSSGEGTAREPTPWRAPPGESDMPSYDWPDAPDTDVEDNDRVPEPVYTMNQALLTITGYEKSKVAKESKPADRPPMQIPRIGQRDYKYLENEVAHTEIKGCLLDMTSDHCCYGNKAAKDMEIGSVEYSEAIRYTLKTFVETRCSQRSHIPFKGQAIEGPQGGAPPPIWDVVNEAHQMYKSSTETAKVPRSSTVETCYACGGRGFNKCYRCKGRGRTKCKYCKAKGQRGSKDCEYCRGKGRQRCFRCIGNAVITCSVCQGYRQLEYYVDVVSKFDVKEDEYLYHAEKRLPRKLLKGMEGISIFDEEAQMLEPLSDYTVTDVNVQSERLVLKHASVDTERFLSQRHSLLVIPLVRVSYTWNGKEGRFWLYGKERRVYAPDYPQQCCCSCRCSIC